MPIVGYTDQATISKQTLPVPVLAMVKKGAEKPTKGVGRNLDHFRFVWTDKRAEDLFNRMYGEDKQHELLITVLSDNVDAVMDSSYRLYSSNNVMQRKCDGCTILSSFQGNEGEACVCDPAKRDSDSPEERRGQCSPKAYFRFTLPELCKALGYLGQFILLTGSVNEMRDIATVLYTVKASTGKLLGQPFLLRRSEREYDIVLKGVPSKSKQFNVELVPPLQLVLSNMNTPILGAPAVAELPSGAELENEASDWVCNGCGNRASKSAAYSLLMECPDCGGVFVHEDDGKTPKTTPFVPPTPSRDINDVDKMIFGEEDAETPLIEQWLIKLSPWINSFPETNERPWIVNLARTVYPMYSDEYRLGEGISAALQNTQIRFAQSIDKAAVELFKNRCAAEWGLADTELPPLLEKALGMSLKTHLENNPRDYGTVWTALKGLMDELNEVPAEALEKGDLEGFPD